MTVRRVGALAAALVSVASLHAVTFNFNMGGNGGLQPSYVFNSNGVTLTVTAWSYESGSFSQGQVGQYSGGLGVMNSPFDNSHTVDNSGRIDFLRFAFSTPIDVNSVTFGYVEDDGDFRYWISNSSTLTTVGGTAVSGNGSAPQLFNLNAGNVYGTHFVVAASLSGSNDAFKVQTLNVTTHNAPDAGHSVALLGLAMVGLAALRRRIRA